MQNFLYTFTLGYILRLFLSLCIVNSTIINTLAQMHFWQTNLIIFGYILSSGFSWSYGTFIFNFLKKLHTVSTIAVLIYIFINHVHGFPFLHTFTSHSNWGEVIAHRNLNVYYFHLLESQRGRLQSASESKFTFSNKVVFGSKPILMTLTQFCLEDRFLNKSNSQVLGLGLQYIF